MHSKAKFWMLAPALVFATLASHSYAQWTPVAARQALVKPNDWYTSDEGKKTIGIVLSWQTPVGGWAKNYDESRLRKPDDAYGAWDGVATIDNGFTYTELRFLARAYNLSRRQDVLDSFNRGLDFLFASQYPSGGWPQRFPISAEEYGKYITFNDDAMTNVMYLLMDIQRLPAFSFVDPARKAKVKDAFDRGVECILNCQIEVHGKLTGWCAQHDPVTFKPLGAHKFELVSISGDEGAAVAIFLMRIDHPTPRMKKAIEAAAAWFAASKITGQRVVRRPSTDPSVHKPDRVVIDDPTAPPMWARFYDIETNRPFFCDRDGVMKFSLAEIGIERRAGYTWLGQWGDEVASAYAEWQSKN